MRVSVEKFIENSPFDAQLWEDFARGIYYVPGDLSDPACYAALKTQLDEIEKERGTGGNVLFYLSTQPSFYASVVEQIGASGLAKHETGWRRVVIEKPFGHDQGSAQELNSRISKVLPEQDIYRIDHYLGKETVQNVLAFRFGNTIFEPLWNRQYISHVQVTAAESIGVEGRGT
jgi:glucose-6-phosphate 1-dehydrogenase